MPRSSARPLADVADMDSFPEVRPAASLGGALLDSGEVCPVEIRMLVKDLHSGHAAAKSAQDAQTAMGRPRMQGFPPPR